MGLIANLTNAEYQVDALQADFVRDFVRFRWVDGPDAEEHFIQYTWTPEHTPQDAINAIDAAILVEGAILDAPPPPDPEANGVGLVVDLGSSTHPQAEITGAELDASLLTFRWLGGPYGGDCAIPFAFTLTTTADDLEAAIVDMLPQSQ